MDYAHERDDTSISVTWHTGGRVEALVKCILMT